MIQDWKQIKVESMQVSTGEQGKPPTYGSRQRYRAMLRQLSLNTSLNLDDNLIQPTGFRIPYLFVLSNGYY